MNWVRLLTLNIQISLLWLNEHRNSVAAELAKFGLDHYLADFFEDEAAEQFLKYNPWWNDAHAEMMASLGKSQKQEYAATLVSFSEKKKYQLWKFVHKSHLLNKKAHRQVNYSLCDVLLAYCSEVHITKGEHNVESSWTIRKLSTTLLVWGMKSWCLIEIEFCAIHFVISSWWWKPTEIP